jgi:hypothetical protein
MERALGRLEEHHYRITEVATTYFREKLDFSGVRQVVPSTTRQAFKRFGSRSVSRGRLASEAAKEAACVSCS